MIRGDRVLTAISSRRDRIAHLRLRIELTPIPLLILLVLLHVVSVGVVDIVWLMNAVVSVIDDGVAHVAACHGRSGSKGVWRIACHSSCACPSFSSARSDPILPLFVRRQIILLIPSSPVQEGDEKAAEQNGQDDARDAANRHDGGGSSCTFAINRIGVGSVSRGN